MRSPTSRDAEKVAAFHEFAAAKEGGGLMGGLSTIAAAATTALVASYVFQILAGRSLGTDGFVAISSLWTVQYLAYAIFLLPLEQLIIRSADGLRGGTALARLRRSLLVTSVGVATVAALLVAAFRDDLVGGDARLAVVTFGIVAGYGRFAFGRGRLSARRDDRGFALATGAEGVGRLLVGLCVFWTGSPLAVCLALLLAPLTIIAWDRPDRTPTAAPPDATASTPVTTTWGPDGLSTQQSLYTITNGCAQLLLGIAPILAAVLGASPRDVSVIFVVATALRAPFWVLTAVSARLLRSLVERLEQPGGNAVMLSRGLLWLAAGTVGAAVAAGAAVVIVPPAVDVLFGAAFRPTPEITAVLTVGAALVAVAMLQGLVLVATGQFREQASAWVVGILVGSVVMAVVPFGAAMRAATGVAAASGGALLGLTAVLVVAAARVRGDRPTAR